MSIVALIFALLVSLAGVARAGEIELRNIQLTPSEEGSFALSTDLVFDFTPRLEEAVNKGIALHFIAEFELTRPRWYFIDEKIAEARQTWRLTYHALTRQYRLDTGGLHQGFTTLEDALHVLSRLRGWTVVEPERLRAGEVLSAALRVRLDISQLPKPFQVEALSTKNWSLSSDWKRWSFSVPATAAKTGAPTNTSTSAPASLPPTAAEGEAK